MDSHHVFTTTAGSRTSWVGQPSVILYLNDPDSTDHPDRIHRARVLGRPRLPTGRLAWRVEVDPPLHGIDRALLADHYVGVSLDELVSSGIGLTPRWRYVPVYVVTALPPASIEREAFEAGELEIAAWADAATRPEDLSGPRHVPVPPLERLPVALVQLERAWRAARAPIVPFLAPGISADEVREAFHGVGLDACAELITWFGWHDGTVGNVGLGHETEEIVPGVFFPPLKECLRLHAQARSMVDDLARADLDPSTYYPAGSFPITRHLGPYIDVVSCDPASPGNTWFVPWDGEAEANGPHLADLVERVAARWKAGITRWENGAWRRADETALGIGPNVPR